MSPRKGETKLHKLVRVPTSFVTEETAAGIRALADAGNRSMSREIRKALEDHVAENFKSAA